VDVDGELVVAGVEIVIALAFVVLSVAALVIVRRRIPVETLEQQHEVAGVCFAVVGGLYGIILAFVLVSSWERYEQARAQTELEASALGDLYRHSEGFNEPARSRLQSAVAAYAESVVQDEWATMTAGHSSQATQEKYYALWKALLEDRPSDAWEVALYQNTLEKLDDFADARRHRLLYIHAALPAPIWTFLIVFGIATVAFTYFFGMRHVVPQVIITAVLAGTIAGTLVLVRETQHPFSGGMRVGDDPFRLVLSHMRTAQTAP